MSSIEIQTEKSVSKYEDNKEEDLMNVIDIVSKEEDSTIIINVVNKVNDQNDQNDKIYSRNNIEKYENINIVDRDEENSLDLFCYNKCSSDDPEFVKQTRGVVFHNDNVVMKTFPYTDEYIHTDTSSIEKFFENNSLNNCSFYDSHEGCLIRMFYFNSKWFCATHRKLNFFKSKWSSKNSFGTLFEEALDYEVSNNETLKNKINQSCENKDANIIEKFQSILDKSKKYMFLLRNNKDNRIVCNPPKHPVIYHVGTFYNDSLSLTDDIGLSYPKKLVFSNTKELCQYVSEIDPLHIQGVIVFSTTTFCKILNSTYLTLFKVRGNEPSVKFRYLQLRMDPENSKLIYNMYPEHNYHFDKYENIIYNIAKQLYNNYCLRYIKREFVSVPKDDFDIIKLCHSWHIENRSLNKVSLEKVIEVLNSQNPIKLNRMIKSFDMNNNKIKSEKKLLISKSP